MPLLGHYTRSLSIGQNKADTPGRILRRDRDISTAGFQHRQHTDHHFQTAIQIQSHGGINGHRRMMLLLVMLANRTGQLVCPFVELTVGQGFSLKYQRNIIRCRHNLCFKLLLECAVLRVRDICLVPAIQQGMAFCVTEERYR
ncbi:hypothetical protein Xcab_04219 [Xenorhabdus cabanillasii JM26]|nr:hypothetical protein Xcab_04219 [Xenorhabdus cabanillasii JM26]